MGTVYLPLQNHQDKHFLTEQDTPSSPPTISPPSNTKISLIEYSIFTKLSFYPVLLSEKFRPEAVPVDILNIFDDEINL